MSAQTTSHIIMVRPAAFGYNVETAANNTFQHSPKEGQDETRDAAIDEFDNFVSILRKEGVEVNVIQDTRFPVKPDAIFPNNWISFHEDGTVVTYPMYSPLRRQERREEILSELAKEFHIHKHIEIEKHEVHNRFLEGTGSMVLDRANKIAYACISPRTDPNLLEEWCALMGYTAFTFVAKYDGVDIYHTNVMMAIGDGICVVCLDVIEPPDRREELAVSLLKSGREIVVLSSNQIKAFAGNMLAVRNEKGEQLMVMSLSAHQSLDIQQAKVISRHARIVSADIHIIEAIGGGSARCMIAENFLPRIEK